MTHIDAFLSNPIGTLAVAVVLTALGSRLGNSGFRAMLIVAGVLLAISVYRTAPISGLPLVRRALWTIMISAGIALALTWVNDKLAYSQGVQVDVLSKTQSDLAASATAPHKESQSPAPHSPTADEIAAAVASRLPTASPRSVMTGPFPPFSLGGSLAKDRLFDFIVDKHTGEGWQPVRESRDVEIDWTQFIDVPLVADVTVRGGSCRVGLLDVANDVPVVSSNLIQRANGEWGWDKVQEPLNLLEPIKHVYLSVPRSNGKKSYRLVVRPDVESRSADTFWVSGTISFPVKQLGGDLSRQFEATDGRLEGPTPGQTEATINWAEAQDPINTVIADIILASWYPVFQTRERARAIVRDVTDGTTVPSEWMRVEWVGGVHASMRPYPGPTAREFKFELPRKVGVHRYTLNVEVSKVGMKASASGALMLRH